MIQTISLNKLLKNKFFFQLTLFGKREETIVKNGPKINPAHKKKHYPLAQ